MSQEPFGPVDELRERAERVLAGVAEQADSAARLQQRALAVTGTATSRDGTVRATVNASGVLTALTFDERAFGSTTPAALANLVVATVQAAARQATEQVRAGLDEINQRTDALLAAAGRPPSALAALRRNVPDVPRTATDPLDDVDPHTDTDPPTAESAEPADADRYFDADQPW